MQTAPMNDDPIGRPLRTALDSLVEIAGACHDAGRAADAKRVLRAASELAELHEARQARLKLLLAEGRIRAVEYAMTNTEAERTVSVLSEAQRLAEASDDPAKLADVLSALGVVRYFIELNAGSSIDGTADQYREAFDLQQQALHLRKRLGDDRGIGESLFHIGTVYERRQQHEQALDCYAQALEAAERAGCLAEKAEPTRHLAFHALRNGDTDGALRLAREALSLREQAGFRPYLPLDHLLLCDVYVKRGEMEQGQSHARQAFELAEEMGYKRAVASAKLSLGDIAAARGEREKAKTLYEQALRLAEELRLPLLIARADGRLAGM